MGYGGYQPQVSGKVAEPLTALEKALRNLQPLAQAEVSLELIEKLCRNVATQPGEEKFRRLRLTNDRIKAALVDVEGATDAMLELGWVREGEETLVLPKETKITMHEHVVKILDAKHHIKKEQEKAKKAESHKMKSLAAGGSEYNSGILGA